MITKPTEALSQWGKTSQFDIEAKVYVKPEAKPIKIVKVMEEPESIEPTFRNIFGLAEAGIYIIGLCMALSIYLYEFCYPPGPDSKED